jgi:hypothetical protein
MQACIALYKWQRLKQELYTNGKGTSLLVQTGALYKWQRLITFGSNRSFIQVAKAHDFWF